MEIEIKRELKFTNGNNKKTYLNKKIVFLWAVYQKGVQ